MITLTLDPDDPDSCTEVYYRVLHRCQTYIMTHNGCIACGCRPKPGGMGPHAGDDIDNEVWPYLSGWTCFGLLTETLQSSYMIRIETHPDVGYVVHVGHEEGKWVGEHEDMRVAFLIAAVLAEAEEQNIEVVVKRQ